MENLIKHLPEHIRADAAMQKIQTAMTAAATAFDDTRTGLRLQMQPSTATWALAMWEKIYRVTAKADFTDARRQENLVARIRISQTLTPSALENICAGYTNGEVEITEAFADYGITIKFVGQHGIPKYLDDVKATVNQFKPAHLTVEYEFEYYLIQDVSALTLAQMEAITMDNFAGGTV